MARPRPTFLQTMIRSEPMRVVQLGTGVVLMAAAPIIGIPTPGPLGIIIFAAGLALVLRNSAWARRKYVRWKHRYPRVGRITDIGLRRRRRKPPLAVPETAAVAVPAVEEQRAGPVDPLPRGG